MGRHISNTVDYYPHFAEQGKTIFILKSRFRNDGYSFWHQLLELLCITENHYYDCREEDDWQYLLAYTGVDEITGTEILRVLTKLGKIDKELWGGKIIWCPKLVANLEEVYDKRKRPLPSKPTLLDNNDQVSPEKPINGTEKVKTGAEIPHSIVEYSIVEYSRVGEKPINGTEKVKTGAEIPHSIVEETPLNVKNTSKKVKNTAVKTVYGEFQNVLLSDDEHQKLVDKFNEADTKERIERLSGYKKSKGVNYKDDYATILNWARKDNQEGRNNGRNGVNRTNSSTDVSGVKNRTAELKAGWE